MIAAHPSLGLGLLTLILSISFAKAEPISVTVPGTANPWLAGAESGTSAAGGDSAPGQSPVLVPVNAGDELKFYVSGWTGYGPGGEASSEGDVGGGFGELNHAVENGIGGISGAPANALIGVFLSDDTPTSGGEPAALDFQIASGNRDALSRLPALRQPFFIGNGVAAGGQRQVIYVPEGATRLFLGTVDGTGWFNNTGSLEVNITVNQMAVFNMVAWETPATVNAVSDVATGGNLVLARNLVRGNGSLASADVTLNSVPFATVFDMNIQGAGGPLFDLTGGNLWNNSHDSASAPFSGLDASYQTLLSTGVMRLGTAAQRRFQLTFNDLVIGETYTMQFWVNGSNNGGNPFDANHYRTIISTPSGSIQLDPNSTNDDGGVGQHVIGAFTAAEPGITLEFDAEDGGFPILNGFQLRQGTTGGGPQIVETELPSPGSSFTVTGGTAPYTFSVQSGSLPAGLELSAGGEISGMALASASGLVTIRVTDDEGEFSDKEFLISLDLGLPEIMVKRVRIQSLGGISRLASFEVVAGDDVALAPDEALFGVYDRGSQCIEYRYSINGAAFTGWTQQVYYPASFPPQVFYDQGQTVRVELRAIDAAGNRSRVAAYDIAANAGVSATTGGPGVAMVADPVNVLEGVWENPVALFTEDFDNDAKKTPDVLVVDGRGKVSLNRMKAGSLTGGITSSILLPDLTPDLIQRPYSAAHGFLMPVSGVSDELRDVVVAYNDHLKLIVSAGAKTPSLRLLPTRLEVPGHDETYWVAVGDFDGDGFEDVVCSVHDTTTQDRGLAVFYNKAAKGTAGFDAPVLVSGGLTGFHALTAGDVNGDGIDDVVVAGMEQGNGPGEWSLFTFMGNYRSTLSAPSVQSQLEGTPMFVTIADYTGHHLGQKDVLVGLVKPNDPNYPTADASTWHQVFVHQGAGQYLAAPPRYIGLRSNSDDISGFNFAVGHLTRRGLPDVVGHSSELPGGGTFDKGFLPPASADYDYTWMEGNSNGVVSFGQGLGRVRRVALADFNADGRVDVALADASDATVKVMLNTNFDGEDFPDGVKPAPAVRAPGQFNATIIPGGRTAKALEGIASQPWAFSYSVLATGMPANVTGRVEYQRNGGSWLPLPGGALSRRASVFSATVPAVPEGLLRFRCVLASSASSLYDGISLPSAPIRSIESQLLVVSIKAEPDSSPLSNVSTHDDEFITYRLTYQNEGTAPASNVILSAAIPLNTEYGGGGSAGIITDHAAREKVKLVSWNLGTLAPGESGEKFFFAQVDFAATKKLETSKQPLRVIVNSSETRFKASPPANEAAFKKAVIAARSYGLFSAAPAPGFKAQAAGGAEVSTPIVPPLTLIQTVDTNNVSPGGIVNVEIILRNHGAKTIHNILVASHIEKQFVLEGVRLRTPADALTGNFDGFLDDEPGSAFNPSFNYIQNDGGNLTWRIGSLEGNRNPLTNAPQPPGEVRMRYRVRVKYDVDLQTIENGELVANRVNYFGLAASGMQQVGGSTTARTDILPPVSQAMVAAASPTIPRIHIVKEIFPLVGADPLTATEPSVRQEMRVGGEDKAVVAVGGLMRVKLRYYNTGDETARRCVIHYEVPDKATFLGFLRRDGIAESLASNYEFFDSKGLVIPAASLSTRIKQTRRIRFLLGELAAGVEGVTDFILAAFTPPVPKPANEKPTPAGQEILSKAYSMETDSLVNPVRGVAQTPFFVAKPVSFDIETRPDKVEFAEVLGTPQDVRFLISYRNNGWIDASNVKILAEIPVGTTLVSANLLNRNDLSPTGALGTVQGSRVMYDLGTVPSGYEDHPDASGYVEMIVRLASPLPFNFPKDRRIRQRVEITSTDAKGRATVVGSYSLFSATAGNDIKTRASADSAIITVLKPALLPTPARLIGGKKVPMYGRVGERLLIPMTAANSGDEALTNVKIAIQVPAGTELVAAGTTPGYKLTKGNILTWTFPTLAGHDAVGADLMVRVKNNSGYEGQFVAENSCVMQGTANGVILTRIPGKTRTLIQSNSPLAASWQFFTASLQAMGGNLFGQRTPEIETEVAKFERNSMTTCIAGADIIQLANGGMIVPLQGGKILASGGGNLIANDGASIIAGGAGNLLAVGSGQIIAAGAGNAINMPSVGLLTTSNLSSLIAGIVASGGGNIIASGGGNLIANDGASLIANDGASLGPVFVNANGIIASGGGNIVGSGGGNVVASGGGNILPGGAENMASTRPGAALLPAGGALIIVNPLIANDGASILGDQGGGLIGNDGAGSIGSDGASLIRK